MEDVQLTVVGGPGGSPFTGINTDVNITAIVQNDPSVSGLIILQDDADMAPWSGIFLSESETMLQQGDELQISSATIAEGFGVTELRDAVYEVASSGNAPIDYKMVNTTILQDDAVAEAHEGMLLRFEDVVVGINPDDPRDFGEWSFATAGTEDFLRADDASAAVPAEFNDALPEGTELTFIKGVWWYSFGNYKLVPESGDDVGLPGVDVADGELPFQFALQQNYPNPFNPTTSIQYAVPTSGHITLEVFDILGRAVNTLVDGVVNAGEHTIEFDAASLPSGMYLYRLSAGEKVTTKKMLLLK